MHGAGMCEVQQALHNHRVASYHCVDVKGPTRTMPMDFAAYLLSASPPGFDMYNHFSGAPGFNHMGLNGHHRPFPSAIVVQARAASDSVLNHPACDAVLQKPFKRPNSIATCRAEDHPNLTVNKFCEDAPEVTVSCSQAPPKIKKRVSFADDLGLALEMVKIMYDASDSPPSLRPEILSSLTRGALAGVTDTSPLVLNFPQPASDYLAFREKLEKNFVSLENVILKDYSLIGTVKVKNICFEKTVSIRYTLDSWEQSTDIAATYAVNNSASNLGAARDRYDTFKFEIHVPPTQDFSHKVQFCVCFEANNNQHWDNNSGANYEVASADWKQKDAEDPVFTINYETNWTLYSCWSSKDPSVPYY